MLTDGQKTEHQRILSRWCSCNFFSRRLRRSHRLNNWQAAQWGCRGGLYGRPVGRKTESLLFQTTPNLGARKPRHIIMWLFVCQKADIDIRSYNRPDDHESRSCKGNARLLYNESAMSTCESSHISRQVVKIPRMIFSVPWRVLCGLCEGFSSLPLPAPSGLKFVIESV